MDTNIRTNTKWGCVLKSVFVNFRIFVLFVFSYGLFPLFTFAQWKLGDKPTNLTQFVQNFISILNPVILFAALFGFFGIITGILKYVGAGGNEERLGKARQLIIYGFLGLLVIFSFWGIANLLAKTYFGI